MTRDYYSHADPCRETVPRNHHYQYLQNHTFRHKASNFVRQLNPGRYPHGYYSKRYKPSRSRYTENAYQPRVHGPSVYDSNHRPFGSLCTFDRTSSFHREFKRRGSKPREAESQQTRRSHNGLPERYVRNRYGTSLQQGSSKNQFHNNSRKFSSNVRSNESGSRSNSGYDEYPRYWASLGERVSPNRMYSRNGFVVSEPHHRRRRPNRTGSRFNSGYDEYPRYWASLDERITPNRMYLSDGFVVSPKPHHRRRRPHRTGSHFNSGYDEYPKYWASPDTLNTSSGQFQPNKSIDLKNNYKRPQRSRRHKAINPKKQTASIRGQIAETSDSDTSTDTEPESPTEYTKPIYHITWDGDKSKECKHFEQICPICENDFSYILVGDYSYYEDDNAPPKLPEVAVLPCGHAFHSECLTQFTEEEPSREPPCFFCISNEIY